MNIVPLARHLANAHMNLMEQRDQALQEAVAQNAQLVTLLKDVKEGKADLADYTITDDGVNQSVRSARSRFEAQILNAGRDKLILRRRGRSLRVLLQGIYSCFKSVQPMSNSLRRLLQDIRMSSIEVGLCFLEKDNLEAHYDWGALLRSSSISCLAGRPESPASMSSIAF